MEIPVDLQPQALLVHPTALAEHLQTILAKDPSRENLNSINSHILHQTHIGAIPSFVYLVWLFIAYRHLPHLVSLALRDQISAGVRKAGIKVVRHIFQNPLRRVYGWDQLGGVQGIKAILDGLSLAEVRFFVKAISKGSQNSDKNVPATNFDELANLIQESDNWTSRSLRRHLAPLFARCSSTKVTELLRSGILISHKFGRYVNRSQQHMDLLRQMAIGKVETPLHVHRYILEIWGEMLVQSKKPYVPIHATKYDANISSGLKFGMDLLSNFKASKSDPWSSNTLIRQWTQRIIKLAISQRLPFDSLLLIIVSSLEMWRDGDSSLWPLQYLPQEFIRFWSMARFGKLGPDGPFGTTMKEAEKLFSSRLEPANQAALELCLVEQVLHDNNQRPSALPFSSSYTARLDGLLSNKLLSYVHIDGRFEFLQLLCKHSPYLNFDLTVWPPSEEERKLVPVWKYNVLSILPKHGAKALFQRSLEIHKCNTFLSEEVLESNPCGLDWEQQCRLWATWESLNSKRSESFSVTLKAFDEMKQRATRERDSKGRLRWARAAIQLAAKTNSVAIFGDSVEWSKRFLRDHAAGDILSCGAKERAMKLTSESELQDEVQMAHLVLKGLLETLLLLLREPWARNMRSMTMLIPSMFSTVIRQRMDAVRSYALDGLATESILGKILLDSLLSVIIDYETKGNREDQAAFSWSGPKGLIRNIACPDNPSKVELSFIDRLAKARDDLWRGLRAQINPDIFLLEPGWPRGLPIQDLVPDEAWLCHALQRTEETTFLSSRISDLLFSPQEIILAPVREDAKIIGSFVDDLGFAIRAIALHEEQADRMKWITLVWDHYSSVLRGHPLQLELLQEGLIGQLKNALWKEEDGLDELINIILAPIPPAPLPLISKVPTGSETTEWDPHEDFQDTLEASVPSLQEQRPREIPCIVLNSRMRSTTKLVDGLLLVRTKVIKPEQRPDVVAIWTKENSFDNCEAIILSALLFLDTLVPHSRLLQTGFPDSEGFRYGPTYLADEFIIRLTKAGVGNFEERALRALKRNSGYVPAQILRDLIRSLLDTMKASPSASNYPTLLNCTLQLMDVLLNSDEPHLVVEVALKMWQDFPDDSSSHRKLSLVKIGRFLTPGQASKLIETLVSYADGTIQRQPELNGSSKKPFIKVTTLKMFTRGLAEADFIAPSTRVYHLERMFDTRSHIDVRVQVVESLLKMVNLDNSVQLFKALSTAAMFAAGSSERDIVTDQDWRTAEAGGPLPPVLDSQRPILDILVSRAKKEIPSQLHSDYCQKVVLPLVTESIGLHSRWMTLLLARLGLSLPSLGLVDLDVGPFSFDLVDDVFCEWEHYLPGKYLECHRSWDLSCLKHDSFTQIAEAFKSSADMIASDTNVRDHLQAFIKSQTDRRPLHYAFEHTSTPENENPNGITNELFINDFVSRVQLFVRSPMLYNPSFGRYSINPVHTLNVLRLLRRHRGFNKDYEYVEKLMMSIIRTAESVRRQGWSPGLTAHPATVPSSFEYEVQLLPGLYWKNELRSLGMQEFVSGINDLISKYGADPVLLMKFDVFEPILEEFRKDDKLPCALLLGEDCDDEDDQHRPTKVWVRVKLAAMLLQDAKKSGVKLEESALDMVERWKASEIEMVRGIAWELDWST
ncbi:hypothetical protein N7520_004407 [Penicillium odoratum]|uniref:uncharacterized protein n=1 Tax=Penicillium odoratum TaxID=1167516 RepID=UPI002546975A|nr:uncharacterized protein N7520_004407 [Penicillium odoratum]KAJ5764848.1 hypothetical protein N7520_004407 [Penicillium odoratum]